MGTMLFLMEGYCIKTYIMYEYTFYTTPVGGKVDKLQF